MTDFTLADYDKPLSRAHYEHLYADRDLRRGYLSRGRMKLYREVAAAAAGILNRIVAASVLDVGCGMGHLLAEIHKRAPTANLSGLDWAESAIRWAKEVCPPARFWASNLFDLDIGGAGYDLVLCVQVLEHMEIVERALAALLWRLQCPGGCLLLTVPNGAQDRDGSHINKWTLAPFAALLAPYGKVEARLIRGGQNIMAMVEIV